MGVSLKVAIQEEGIADAHNHGKRVYIGGPIVRSSGYTSDAEMEDVTE